VLRGSDLECLHQYRVRLRRLRALLSRLRQVLPREVAAELTAELGELARRTGRLRDLDVMLLAEPAYRRLVPELLRPRLTQAFVAMRRRRGLDRGRFARLLRSATYATRMARVEQLLAKAAASPATGKATQPIGQVVRRRIRKTYKALVDAAAGLAGPAPATDAAYHRLRIRGKRLRYLLDLFRDLLARRPTTALVRRLQALQEVLGAMNDLAVQRGHLQGLLASGEASLAGQAGLSAAVSMEALWERLDRQRSRIEREARQRLADLCERRSRRLVNRL